MFTDIEGSTALLERAGDRYPDLLARHRQLVRGAIVRHGGVERGTEGDSFFVTFDSASSALAAGVEAQRAVELEPWPDGLRIRIRMGLHIGEVLDHDNDLVGMAIHHAARIAATAHGGQIVLSDSVRDMSPALPPDVQLRSLGVHRLRDIGATEVFQVDHPDLQTDFPPLRGVVQPRTNLPLPRTALVGGDAVLAAMADQLAHGSLLTLTGSGGVGKTRLAIEYARRHVGEFESGAVLVDLAAIAGDGAVAGAIATALSVYSGSSGSPLEVLVDWVADRQLLLVIDNCEHLLAEVGDTLDALTSRCPRLTVLATSREAVGVPGERVLRVPSLDPVTDATDLFLQRARAADTSFAVDGHRDTVVQICTRLDGIPLAIELAAARCPFAVPAGPAAAPGGPLPSPARQRPRHAGPPPDAARHGLLVVPAAAAGRAGAVRPALRVRRRVRPARRRSGVRVRRDRRARCAGPARLAGGQVDGGGRARRHRLPLPPAGDDAPVR